MRNKGEEEMRWKGGEMIKEKLSGKAARKLKKGGRIRC